MTKNLLTLDNKGKTNVVTIIENKNGISTLIDMKGNILTVLKTANNRNKEKK